MALSTPASFEPLSSSNPVPADTDAMTSLGQQYTSTAAMIEQQANDLQQLSNSSADAWKSKAGSVFTSKASSLSSRITQAEQRYKTAGAALTAAAGPMYDAQQQAYAAVQQAQEAEQTMKANAPAPPPAKGSPPLTDDQKAAAATAAKNYSAAQDSLSQAQSQFNSAVEAYETAAKNAANQINDELDHDPLKDSWFQQHFGWLLNFFHILAYIVMGLAILALLIACPFSAGFIAGILGVSMSTLAAVGTVIDVATLLISVGTTVFDGVAAGEGLESWQSFGLDILGLATFGLGKGAGAVSKSITKDATAAGEKGASDFASKGAKDAFGDTAKNDYLDSRAGHNLNVGKDPNASTNGFVFGNATYTGMKAGAKAAGDAAFNSGDAAAFAKIAGSTAAKAIGKIAEDTPAGNLSTILGMNGDIAKDLAGLNAVQNLVPNVAKVGAGVMALKGLVGVNGIIQWGGYGVSVWTTTQPFGPWNG
jgi:uncharacterized protein YukE